MRNPKESSGAGPRLIIVCGLPGSGKTTHAKLLEDRLRAIRFSPDEWMDALSLDFYDEGKREKVEGLQWKFGQGLLALGLTVIIEWALGDGPSGICCDLAPGILALRLNCTIFPRQSMFSSTGFDAVAWRIRP
jgi:hypothetical protein